MTIEAITPREGAALLLAWLETRSAVTRLDDEDFVGVDLNPIAGLTAEKAAKLAHAILCLRVELRAILAARRVTH